MRNNTLNFTKAILSSLPLPLTGKRAVYKDIQVKGLIVEVRPSGTKSFTLYKKINGRPERILLGAFPDLSVELARKQALVKLGAIALGGNPQEEKRRVRAEMTLGQLFEQYMARYSKLHKKSWIYDQREIPKFLSHWFKRRLTDITRTDVIRLREKVFADSGLYQSNRLLERIRALYNKAIEWGWEGANPTLGIKKYREKSRDRFVQPAEMPCLLRSLNEEENATMRDFFWLLLLTGARKTNTLMMRWEEINWQRQEWRIPDTKNGEPLLVPLTERAIDILKHQHKAATSVWVFPQEDDATKHLVNIKRAWNRILERATLYYWQQDKKLAPWLAQTERRGLPYLSETASLYRLVTQRATQEGKPLPTGLMDVRVHDVRRTYGSYQALTGASLQIIGKSLGHKSTQATQIYARLNLDAVRSSVERATDAMFQSS